VKLPLLAVSSLSFVVDGRERLQITRTRRTVALVLALDRLEVLRVLAVRVRLAEGRIVRKSVIAPAARRVVAVVGSARAEQ
jgi:hypothetical protein